MYSVPYQIDNKLMKRIEFKSTYKFDMFQMENHVLFSDIEFSKRGDAVLSDSFTIFFYKERMLLFH